LALDRQLLADVIGRRLPALVIDGAAAQHLEILCRPRSRGRGVGERGRQAGAVDWPLADAVEDRGNRDAGRARDRRHDVDGVTDLAAQPATRRDPAWPVHDQRRPHATEPGVALPETHRRVAGPGPAPGVVVVGAMTAEVADARERLADVVDQVVREA